MFLHPTGGGINDGFTFMDGVEDVVEDSSSIATFCLLLNLQAGQTLGCPVTVTMEIMNGNNASKLNYEVTVLLWHTM